MFANVRLMIVAISASLLAVICAMALFMGVFAAFSVAHEPFATLTAAKPPLQIALADNIAAPVADGKPAPFGVRFQLNAPQIPNGPIIVAVPQAVDRAAPPDAVAEPMTDAAANAQPPSQDATGASPAQSAPDADVKVSGKTNEKPSEAKPDSIDGTTVANSAASVSQPQPESPPSDRVSAAANSPHHLAPQTRIASREPDNPASVTTAPAPTLAGNKAMKRRKLAAHLRQSHHFRRPRIHQIAAGPTQSGYTTGVVQSNAYQPAAPSYATGTYAPSNGFIQPGFGYTPAVIRPRATKFRRAASSNSQ